MNYERIYNNIITRAQNRQIDGYIENHHIIPKCLGGTDDNENITKLTAREHYIAHQLLIKINPLNYKLVYAAMMMCVSGNGQLDRSRNRYYAWIRELYRKAVSERQRGAGNSQHGTFWVYSIELKESKKIPKQDLDIWIQQGYIKGRKMSFIKKPAKTAKCNECHNIYEVQKEELFCSTDCHLKHKIKASKKRGFPKLNDEQKEQQRLSRINRIWISHANSDICKRVLPSELTSWLAKGYVEGRGNWSNNTKQLCLRNPARYERVER